MVVDLAFAPFAVLAFIAAALGTVLGVAVILTSKFAGSGKLARLMTKVLIVGLSAYVLLMLAASLTSHEHLLARGEEKHFCEIDCHIAYSVVDVQKTSALSGAAAPLKAGNFYVITLRTRFDETTIGPHRGNGTLQPNEHQLSIVDARGNLFSPIPEANGTDAADPQDGTPLDRPLRPGEHYETKIIFDLPASVEAPRLLVWQPAWPNTFLIGHENSPLHKKAYFAL